MTRSAVAHDLTDLKDDVKVLAEDLRDVLAPKVESVLTTVAERIPDDVVDRLPDAVTDQFPQASSKRGGARKILVIGALAAAGGVAFVLLRRGRSVAPAPRQPARPAPSSADRSDGGSGLS